MATLSQVTWMTLIGLSLLFVGGFVLWVYGAERAQSVAAGERRPDPVARHFYEHLVRWFLLYGAIAAFAGVGLLITSAVIAL